MLADIPGIGSHDVLPTHDVDDYLRVLVLFEPVDDAVVLLRQHDAQETFHTGQVGIGVLIDNV